LPIKELKIYIFSKEDKMTFNTGAALLDAIVLAVVSKEPEGTYGYRITQEVRQVIELSESTLYPVLRRLQKDDCLEVYDREFGGRNRRYYKTTSRGWAQLTLYENEWRSYAEKVSGLLASNGGSKLDASSKKN
jgi:PadR family transcriptional regulator PadR